MLSIESLLECSMLLLHACENHGSFYMLAYRDHAISYRVSCYNKVHEPLVV